MERGDEGRKRREGWMGHKVASSPLPPWHYYRPFLSPFIVQSVSASCVVDLLSQNASCNFLAYEDVMLASKQVSRKFI